MTPQDWLSNGAALAGAGNSTLASYRNPIINLPQGLPGYQVPLARASGTEWLYPGFGWDPEAAALAAQQGGLGGITANPVEAQILASRATSGTGADIASLLAGKAAPMTLGQLTKFLGNRLVTDGTSSAAAGTVAPTTADTATAGALSDATGAAGGADATVIDPSVLGQDAAGQGLGLGASYTPGAGPAPGAGSVTGDLAPGGEVLDPGLAGTGSTFTTADPGSAGGSFLSDLPFNPVNLGAGMLGSWAGGQIAHALVPGDPEQQPIASSLGGSLGGALGGVGAGAAFGAEAGSFIIPGIGTLVGALLGSILGGTMGGGSPDIPYSFSHVTLDPTTRGLVAGQGDALNHGNAAYATRLGQSVSNYLATHAAQDGLQWDPTYANTGFDVGTYDGKLNYEFRTGLEGAVPGSHYYDWQGDTPEALASNLYAALQQRGILTRTPTANWADTVAQMEQQRTAAQAAYAAAQARPDGADLENFDWFYQPYTDAYLAQRGITRGTTPGHLPRSPDAGSSAGTGDSNATASGPPGPGDVSADADAADISAEVSAPPADESVSSPPADSAPDAPADAPADSAPAGDAPGDASAPGDAGASGDAGSYRVGGFIPGAPGQPEPITAHAGEFVVRPEAVAKYGLPFLNAINQGALPEAGGDAMPPMFPMVTPMMMPGMSRPGSLPNQEPDADDQGGPPDGDADDGSLGSTGPTGANWPWTAPYANVAEGNSPFEAATANPGAATGQSAMANLQQLPPQTQASVLSAIAADPMVASALLHILGPGFEPLIKQAMLQAAQQAQARQMAMQQQAMAMQQQQQPPGAAAMPPGQAAAPMPGM